MTKHLGLQDQTTEFLLYTAPNGAIKVEVVCSILEHTNAHGAIEGKTQSNKQIGTNCPRVTLQSTMGGRAYE